MSYKRKPIYLLRMNTQAIQATGSLTVYASREDGLALVKKLRAIGIEASPKQPEIHR